MLLRSASSLNCYRVLKLDSLNIAKSIHIHPKNREVVYPNKEEVDLLYPSPGVYLEVDRSTSRSRPGDLNTGL